MRSDIAPGRVFPDYELPDQTGTVRTLSELQGGDPLILTLARGHYCPKEHQQHLELAAHYPKITVSYTQVATISTDEHHTLQEFRASVGAQWPFLSDPGRTVQQDPDIAEYTDPDNNPRIPYTLVLKPRMGVHGPTAVALAAAFRAFDADPDAAAAVLHGEGGVFCSGADLTALGTERGNRVAPDGDAPMGVSRLRLSKPVIAAVSGYAVAGGLELALWCDLRVADETAVFGVFCRRWGVPLIDGGTVRLPRLIGTGRALDMILTGRAVDAGEALAFGLPNRVVPAGRALAAAQELAAQLAAFPQVCLRSDSASVLDQEGLDEAAALASEFTHGRQALNSEAIPGAARFAAGAGRHGSFGP